MGGDRQYRPIMDVETDLDAAITIAQPYEYLAAIDNMKHKVLRHKCFFYTKIGTSSLTSSGSTDEKWMMSAAPFNVPHGYNYFRLRTMSKYTGAAGPVTWRFYASRDGLYTGSSTFDTSLLGIYTTESVITSGALAISNTVTWQIPYGEGPIWLTLTAQTTTSGNAEMYTIDIYPEIV